MNIGDYVKLAVPPDRIVDSSCYGRVNARQIWEDAHGTRVWIHVFWIDHDGKPSMHETKHPESELEPLTPP